jgi:hypothetical protein
MALRLSHLVTCGKLIDTRKNCVHGYVQLQDSKRPLVLQLTGNCAPDLAGRHIRFGVRGRPAQARDPVFADTDEDEPEYERDCDHDCQSENTLLPRLNLTGLAWVQVGPTGTMTTARKVRVMDRPAVEPSRRPRQKPRPTSKCCLYLEWFSQNGRVVVELLNPLIEDVAPGPPPAAGEQTPPVSEPIALDAAGQAVTCDETPASDLFEASPETAEDEPDSYGLIPSDLQRQLDQQARATDRALSEDADGDEVTREMELMDDLIEQGAGEPLGMLFDGAVRLRSPDQLDEQEAEQELRVLLAWLAVYGVALDMCEYFTAAAAYWLMVERICREEMAYPELRGTQWVQHFGTSDFCPQCQAEFERA